MICLPICFSYFWDTNPGFTGHNLLEHGDIMGASNKAFVLAKVVTVESSIEFIHENNVTLQRDKQKERTLALFLPSIHLCLETEIGVNVE